MQKISYKRYRFPPDVIFYAVWLYFRFTLSFRDVEGVLVQRGIEVSCETIRAWTIKFGPEIAARLVDVWPRQTKRERAMFEKLKKAYVKARYSKHYRISEDELDWLGERVEALGRVVETFCSERIDVLKRSAAA